MLRNVFSRKQHNAQALFNGHFVEVKALYVSLFDTIPCVSFIGEIDTSKAYAYIDETCKALISTVYQHAYFEHADQKMYFNNTIFVLKDKRVIELGNNYCQLLHAPDQYRWANALIANLAAFREVKEVEKDKVVRVIGFARQTDMN
ncbi:MAG: hypothetical protein QM731_17970 [Chitinophagaceae bacterium]